ncbi:acyloxyacyl hydrolase [Asticcacaulis sp. ZE23SCel15]|uniref:acyloxyacyl hydrolase n=1 Tax=Asticcacaulis sp. ZE23SCel15 TaxID=3059027 RepID=UPI00265D9728|nr:acyloxyacyl hydrolase [Asticcacaulis sp. ZE23SCel15]WKL58536.1 acyloxyacyl hydrolase [Asticcacaulis sp. ZE23SCel15]
MIKSGFIGALALGVVASVAGSASAGEIYGGAYAHDVTFLGEALGIGAAGREGGADIELGWRSDKKETWDFLRHPSVYVMAAVNTQGDSSHIATGLTWKVNFGETKKWFVRPGFGLAYTDGYDELPDFRTPGLSQEEIARRVAMRDDHIEFGSKFLFQPNIALGYDLSERTSIELAYIHLSNGQILGQGKNQGLDDLGLRVSYKLGN